jgi:hypothetical protein
VSELGAIAPEFVEELLRDVRLSEAQFKAGKGVSHRDAKAHEAYAESAPRGRWQSAASR